jgi:hypothetical protein
MMAVAWRFASAVARVRADPITALAPLSHMLISGFFLIQGFLMRSSVEGNSMTAVTPGQPQSNHVSKRYRAEPREIGGP